MLIVLIVSQLVKLETVSTILPAAENVWPKNVNGSCAVQIVVSIVFKLNEVTFMLIVLIVSQLFVLNTVSIIVPAAKNVCPRKLNGSSFAQIVVSTVLVFSGLTDTLIVLIVTQLFVLATVSMMVPAAVNTCPRNEYGN